MRLLNRLNYVITIDKLVLFPILDPTMFVLYVKDSVLGNVDYVHSKLNMSNYCH